MKKFSLTIILIFLFFILIYTINISSIPSNIILFEGEKINLNTLLGVFLDKKNLETIETFGNMSNSMENKKVKLDVSLFNLINLKSINVNIIPKTEVIPLGDVVGMKLYTDGVLVVGMSEIENMKKQKTEPYENTGIKEGDMIVAINNSNIYTTTDLIKNINKSNGKKIDIKYIREGKIHLTNIVPTKTANNEYKLGLWVRDTAAGVGTLSFYEPKSNMFSALGHGIVDIDTGKLINIADGNIIKADILSIKKGEKGFPGEIKGSIDDGDELGEISKNTIFGVYGNVKNRTNLNINNNNIKEIALRNEIKIGDAKIICTLENNIKEEYNVKIKKVYLNNNINNKSMIVEITDNRLIEKTGGIIQGMSGSPIIQNNKIIGALTHVFINDPRIGYGVFADLMVKKMKETELKN